MAEKPQIPAPHKQTQPKPAQKVSKKPQEEQSNEILVRILGYDVPGSRNIYAGLTRI